MIAVDQDTRRKLDAHREGPRGEESVEEKLRRILADAEHVNEVIELGDEPSLPIDATESLTLTIRDLHDLVYQAVREAEPPSRVPLDRSRRRATRVAYFAAAAASQRVERDDQ